MSALELRRQLLANGYSPTPNIGKVCKLKGWPGVEINDAAIEEWDARHKRFPDTGLRVENGLCVLDLDINHEVIDHVARALEEAEPVLSRSLVRYGKGRKEAWFFRVTEPFGRYHTRRHLAPGADADGGEVHAAEAFGGASARQFGAFGAHTRKPDGSVTIAYEWPGGSPANTPFDTLPELTKEQLRKLIDLIERVLAEHGFTPVLRSVAGEDEATRIYDLVETMTFDCNDGVARSLAELKACAGEDGLRCSAGWLEVGADNRERCLIGRTRTGALTVWETASGNTHMEAALAPTAAAERKLDVARVAEKLKELDSRRRLKLSSEDSAAQAAGKMLQTYAYCPSRQASIVPIWGAQSILDGMTLTNFRTMLLPWCDTEIGPKGGEKKINPADLWSSSIHRITVAGLQMRPDQPRPIFEEHGEKWVNIYNPEVHNAQGGDAGPGLSLLVQLFPEDAERVWLTRCVAYKLRHPEVPGPAVVMVARSHGTGRGTFGELLRRLFGARYVRTLGFDHFAGRTYQSQYTEWMADSLIVLVNESSTADNGSAYRTKHDTYERLKEIVDPRAQERQIIAKGLKAYTAQVCTSFFIATNNPDALPLPAEDRRFWVGTNGEPRDADFWAAFNEWMDDPANIAAFAQYLLQLDLGDYSPYDAPPMTAGKQLMTGLAATDVDRGFELAMANLTADLITVEQIIAAMRQAAELYGLEYHERWQGAVKRKAQAQLVRIGEQNGPNWHPMIDGKRYAVYARDRRHANQWTATTPDDVRREVLRNGSPAATGLPGNILRGLFRDPAQS